MLRISRSTVQLAFDCLNDCVEMEFAQKGRLTEYLCVADKPEQDVAPRQKSRSTARPLSVARPGIWNRCPRWKIRAEIAANPKAVERPVMISFFHSWLGLQQKDRAEMV
jgi:hypothetical protein